MNDTELNMRREFFATVTRNGIAVLFAAWLLGGAKLLKKDLEFVTSLTDKPVADALRILTAKGFITHNREGWSLTKNGLQTITEGITTRNYSESPSSIKESLLMQESILNNDSNTTSDSELFRVDELTDIQATLLEALDDEGINDPARARLLQKPGLTGLHVRRWAKIKRAEIHASIKAGKDVYFSPGLLIRCLDALPDDPPIPDNPDDPQNHLPGCDCEPCRLKYFSDLDANARNKYVTGPFAEYIEH